jgi:hypothetical protein
VREIEFGDGRLSRHGDVPSEEQLSGEAAPHFSKTSAATTKDQRRSL